MKKYDFAILGGGPAGYTAALKAAKMKKKVALIEEDALGGTCLNRGCIPTKTLLETAGLVEKIREADKFAVQTTKKVSIDKDALRNRKNNITETLKGGLQQMILSSGIDIISGRGVLKGKDTIKVCGEEKYEIQAEKILIATGTREASLKIDGSEHMMTSTDALEIENIPDSICIVGGGVIGVELATFYNGIGCKVYIMEALSKVLSNLDEEMSNLMRKQLVERGIEIHENCFVQRIEKDQDNRFQVYYTTGDEEQAINVGGVLNATGRTPNTEGLGLEECGVKLTNKGYIEVDEFTKTAADHIYAAGDVSGGVLLAHVAFHEGRIAAENAFGAQISTGSKTAVPQCIYTHPEMASVGLTEEQAKAKFKKLRKGYFSLGANGRALAAGDNSGIVKVITEQEFGQIVGVHIIGERATEVIGTAVIAIEGEYTCEEFSELIIPHPTVCEALKDAASGCVR